MILSDLVEGVGRGKRGKGAITHNLAHSREQVHVSAFFSAAIWDRRFDGNQV